MSRPDETESQSDQHEKESRQDSACEQERIEAAYQRRKTAAVRGRYSHFDAANLLAIQVRERRVLKLLKQFSRTSLEQSRILEIGCGTGFWFRQFIQWGARPENLVGVDLLADRIDQAKRLCPPTVSFHCGSAAELNLPAESFDIVLQSTVFTSVLDAGLKRKIAEEMLRVLKPEGLLLWYDFWANNPGNKDVRGVTKREIQELFPGCRLDLKRITLAPPLARRVAPYSPLLCYFLEKIPLLCTHYLGAIQKERA